MADHSWRWAMLLLVVVSFVPLFVRRMTRTTMCDFDLSILENNGLMYHLVGVL